MFKVQHCVTSLDSLGGVETYVKALVEQNHSNLIHQALYLNQEVDQSQFELLHIHTHYHLEALTGQCPAVFTSHNHTTYCPSGSKYLALKHSCCDREMSVSGCLWGHLADGCGSRKPNSIWKNFYNSYSTLNLLKKSGIPVIAVSNYVRNQLIRHGLSSQKIFTVHNGISIPVASTNYLDPLTHQKHRILFVGRVVPYKGLDWLLHSLAHVNSQIHLDIAGEGWDQPRIEKLASSLGLENRITWHGWCSAEKLSTLYQQCFALIFPSLWHEPAGLVTLEAYAHRRAVIGSQVGGIPEYIHNGKTGILVPVNDIKSLAIAITDLAENYSKAMEMGYQGYNFFMSEFTIGKHMEKLEKVYEQIIREFKFMKTGIES